MSILLHLKRLQNNMKARADAAARVPAPWDARDDGTAIVPHCIVADNQSVANVGVPDVFAVTSAR
jgi:hypothetical protein